MNYNTLSELAAERVTDLIDQLVLLQNRGDTISMAIVREEIEDLTRAMDGGESFFFAPYISAYRNS